MLITNLLKIRGPYGGAKIGWLAGWLGWLAGWLADWGWLAG
jgi:hypothetical protein